VCRTFQPTLPSGKAELVRSAKELHAVGRAEGTKLCADVGCAAENPAKQARLFLYTLFKACKNTQGVTRVCKKSSVVMNLIISASRNSHFISFSQRALAKFAGVFLGSLVWYLMINFRRTTILDKKERYKKINKRSIKRRTKSC